MFKRNQKNLAVGFALLILVFVIFSRPSFLSALKFKIIGMTSVGARALAFPIHEIKKILYYHRTFNEYKRLKTEVDSLRARMTGFEEVVLENSRLEKLFAFRRRLVYPSVAAHVIGRDPSYWNSSMIIDRGEEDGLKEGMPVVNAFGVIGKISEVGPDKAKVILLTDPQFSVAALVQRARESGLVSGTLQGVCRLEYIQEHADVRVGDKVVTSKLSSDFPESMLIGEIVRIYEDPKNPSVVCIIKPAVSFSQIEEVLVILN